MNKIFYFFSLFSFIVLAKAGAQPDTTLITLRQCTEAALNYNPVIKRASNEYEISGLAIKTAKAGFYPTVFSSFSGGLSNEVNKGNDYRTGNWEVKASQTLWQKGMVSATANQAIYTSNAVAYSLEGAKRNLVLAVKMRYFSYYLQHQLFNIAKENVAKTQLFLEYAQERYRAGVGRKTDVLKAESDLAEAKFELDTYMNSMAQEKNELIMLTGLQFRKEVNFENFESLWDQYLLNNTGIYADSLYAMALSAYPELQSANNISFSQDANIRIAEAALYPRLNIVGGYNWTYNPMVQQQKGWYSALSLQWTIFNGKELQYALQSEKVRKSVYENQKTEIEDLLLKEIRNGILNINNAGNKIRLTGKWMKTTASNLEIAMAEYQTGVGSMLELTDARIADLTARKNYEQSITDFLIAFANLERLTEK